MSLSSWTIYSGLLALNTRELQKPASSVHGLSCLVAATKDKAHRESTKVSISQVTIKQDYYWNQSHDFIILVSSLHWVARQLRSPRTQAVGTEDMAVLSTSCEDEKTFLSSTANGRVSTSREHTKLLANAGSRVDKTDKPKGHWVQLSLEKATTNFSFSMDLLRFRHKDMLRWDP